MDFKTLINKKIRPLDWYIKETRELRDKAGQKWIFNSAA